MIFLFAFIFLALLEYVLVGMHFGHWIELVNGATWPQHFTDKKEDQGFWFFVFLALRTALNLGITVTAGFGVYFFTGPGRILMKLTNIENALAIQNEALAGVILKALHESDIQLTEPAVDKVYEAVNNFSKNYFTNKVLEASTEETETKAEAEAESKNRI